MLFGYLKPPTLTHLTDSLQNRHIFPVKKTPVVSRLMFQYNIICTQKLEKNEKLEGFVQTTTPLFDLSESTVYLKNRSGSEFVLNIIFRCG